MPARKLTTAGIEAKETLTAVVLADSFTQRFRPLSIERPKVLMPLVNAPMIDYTLEWLAINDIEEVFVFCCAHADKVQAHLQSAGWLKSRKFKVHLIVSTNCLSMGDAMRLLDHKDVIKNDFVLVAGDVVSNMKLGAALEAHKERRAADKTSIMTMVMRGGMSDAHRRRLGDVSLTLVMDPTTKRLVKIEEHDQSMRSSSSSSSTSRRRPLRLDCHLFGERDDLQVRTDLLDTNIYVCAPEVLMLFSDNFDYQNLRRDFVTGVLSEEELGNKLFIYEVTREYAARVHNFRSYDAVSRDLLGRWAYPLVPDTNLFSVKKGGKNVTTAYRAGRAHVYIDGPISIGRTSTISRDCCIASNCTIGEGSTLEGCVLGSNCRIGANVHLRGCYLHDDVDIRDHAVLRCALLADRVVIKEGAVIEPGCVLSYGVVIDKGVRVQGNTQVSLCRPPEVEGGSEDELEVPTHSTSLDQSTFSDDDDDPSTRGMEGPSSDALQAAAAVAEGGIPEQDPGFDIEVVGQLGAGYVWATPCSTSTTVLPAAGTGSGVSSLDIEEVERYGIAPLSRERLVLGWGGVKGEEEGGSDTEGGLMAEDSTLSSGGLGGGSGAAANTPRGKGHAAGGSSGSGKKPHTALSPELHFKQEVAETFLRCVKENISHENVIIELNGLKIAEDKTFADCARYMLTTLLGICLPPPPGTLPEYMCLYNKNDLDTSSKEGRIELIKRATTQLQRWKDLLIRFLRSEDDQVELLLTFEEFCGGEGDYETSGERGDAYSEIFPQLLKLLYDEDVVGEEAVLQWADEKAYAEESERVFLNKAAPFVEWLREASEEEESSDDEEESD